MEQFFLRISLTILLYVVLTLPFLSYIFFDFGIEYNIYDCLVVSLLSVVG